MTDPITEIEHRDLLLTRPRRGATLWWTDEAGGHRIALKDTTLVGSAEQLAARVLDRAVSRLHAELEVRDEGVWLRDLGSRNGTWFAGARVDRVLLKQDAKFEVGRVELELRFEASGSIPLWPEGRLGPMIGQSEGMRELFLAISQYAHVTGTVLIRGETGTGKELVAQALHEMSPRSKGPFVVVDCGALPDALLEGELFGHVKGAFTGADADREGAIEAADGGTLFLDEVGELPRAVQSRLLRALESKTVRRVGQNKHAPVDVRVVAATHRDLETMVAQGEFREDLFFRLAVLPLHVPPLRERSDDVLLLLKHFMGPLPVTQEIVSALEGHRWAGNVRELRTFAERVAAVGVERALALQGGGAAPIVHVASGGGLPPVSIDVPFKTLRAEWNDHLEREYLKALFAAHGRDVRKVAELAGLDRTYVHRLVKKHGI